MGSATFNTVRSVCLDASFLLNAMTERLTEDDDGRWQAWLANGRSLIAPRLLHYEIANALHKARRRDEIDASAVQHAMVRLIALPVDIADDDTLSLEALTLADELGMSASYDAHYLALARRHGAELWTSDHRFWSVASARFQWVHYAPERLPGT